MCMVPCPLVHHIIGSGPKPCVWYLAHWYIISWGVALNHVYGALPTQGFIQNPGKGGISPPQNHGLES